MIFHKASLHYSKLPWYDAAMQQFMTTGIVPLWVIIVLALWTLPWKGVALWKAARLAHTKWFIFLLIVNTLGIVEIIYIYFVARKAERQEEASETEE